MKENVYVFGGKTTKFKATKSICILKISPHSFIAVTLVDDYHEDFKIATTATSNFFGNK